MELHNPSGIMADSHGDCESLHRGIELLRSKGCERLFHLGDICDSGNPSTADQCVALMRDHRVTGVKGNNDHIIVVNHNGGRSSVVSPPSIEYLRSLPPLLEWGTVAFTHSLPFYSWMGNSALMRVVEDEDRRLMFSGTDYRVIFRGHSHSPEYYSFRESCISGGVMRPGDRLRLDAEFRYVITCGALIEGYALVFDRDEVECITLR